MTNPPLEVRPGPERILFAIDGSAASDTAVELVGGLAWPPGTSLRVVRRSTTERVDRPR